MALRVDTAAIALLLYAVFPVLYLCLLAFLLGMWAGDRLVFKGIRRQAIGHVVWKDDVVLVQPIPKDIDRSKPWSSRIWQDPS